MSLIQKAEAINKMASWDRCAHLQEGNEALPFQVAFNSTLRRIVPQCPFIVEC